MRGLFLAVFALFIVAGDSGRYAPQLVLNARYSLAHVSSDNIGHVNSVFAMLWVASLQGSNDAQTTFLDTLSYDKSDDGNHSMLSRDITIYWLEKLVQLDNADAAWLLYQLLGEDGASERFMRLAALGNVAQAQLAFAMATDSPEKREKWLVRAAAQNYVPAQAALADWYLLHGQYKLAKPLLAATASLDMQSAFKYGRLLWDEGNTDEAKIQLSRAAELGHVGAQRAMSVINKFTPMAVNQVAAFDWASLRSDDKACLQRIQPFATSLATITRAQSIYSEFVNDDRLKGLSLCIAPPIWLKSNVLDCEENFNKTGVLGCSVTPLAGIAKTRGFTHAIVIAEQGKANVQNGVMYLDVSDAYSVFVHELAHFAGFADEYPIGRAMARRLCDESTIGDFTPPNIIVDSEFWYAPHQTVDNWLNIDPATIVAPAKTCALIGKKSYKPSRRITFMEHHDSGVIPPLYLVLWEQQLNNQQIQRPISMNFFQAFHQSGNQQEAGHWLSQYQSFIGESSADDE